jgi:hypothetical protein
MSKLKLLNFLLAGLVLITGIGFLTPGCLATTAPKGIVILPVRNGGGLDEQNREDRQLTTGLVTILRERLGVPVFLQSPPKGTTPALYLNCELSRGVGPDGTPGAYFLVGQATRDAKGKQSVYHFAATAHTYQDLAANLGQDSRVDLNGLIGEVARGLTGFLSNQTTDPNGFLAACLPVTTTAIRIETIPGGGVTMGNTQPSSGQLRITSPVQGALYVVRIEDGKATGLVVPVRQVQAGFPTTVPIGANSTTVRYAVLCREGAPSESPVSQVSGDAPVRFIDSRVSGASTAGVSEITRQLKSEPGRWVASIVAGPEMSAK